MQSFDNTINFIFHIAQEQENQTKKDTLLSSKLVVLNVNTDKNDNFLQNKTDTVPFSYRIESYQSRHRAKIKFI